MIAYLSSLPSVVVLGLIWGVLALGVFISYKILDIPDLTVDGSIVTGGAVCALVIWFGGSYWLGILAGFLAGCVCGLVTGLLHTLLGIPPILAGILTQLALWSVNLKIVSLAGNSNKIGINGRYFDVLLTRLDIYNALWKMGIVVALLVVVLYIFFGTELGASIRATGNNPRMSRAQGINTKFNIVLGLMISNGIVALAGALFAQYSGGIDINDGRGKIVIGLCAVVIGVSIANRISSNFLIRMSGVFVGGFIYEFVFQTVVFLGFDTDLLKMLAALVVAIFLGFPYLYRTYLAKIVRNHKNKKLVGGESHD